MSLAPNLLQQPILPGWFTSTSIGQVVVEQRSGDATSETRIVREVASYGRQLGRMMPVLDLLLDQFLAGKPALTDEQRAAVQDFKAIAGEINRVLWEQKPRITARSTPYLLEALRALRRRNRQDYLAVATQLRHGLAESANGGRAANRRSI